MKKLIITCTMVALGSIASFAQSNKAVQTGGNASAPAPAPSVARAQGPTSEQMAERRAKAYQQQLGLSDAQYTSVYQTVLDYVNQQKAARENGGQMGEGQAMQLEMMKDQRFQAVMTADQFAKYSKTKTVTKQNSTPASR